MPDAAFAHPRLAAIYDAFDDDRSDLDAYEALVATLVARTVLRPGGHLVLETRVRAWEGWTDDADGPASSGSS